MYSWWRQTFGVIFKAPNFPHSIFDPLSCTETQWLVDKVMIEHSLHSVLISDILTARFPLDCSRAAVWPCTLFRVCCRPHSEGSVGISNLGFDYFQIFKYSGRDISDKGAMQSVANIWIYLQTFLTNTICILINSRKKLWIIFLFVFVLN